MIGAPPRPVPNPDWTGVKFGKLPQDLGDGIEVVNHRSLYYYFFKKFILNYLAWCFTHLTCFLIISGVSINPIARATRLFSFKTFF